MRETFGTRLRQQRERRGLPVAEIAAQTKIKASLLDGLERDDVSQWPTGIFRRAYVKSYAAMIGYDPDAAAREFLELYPEPEKAIEPPAPPPNRLRSLVESALGSFRKPTPSSATTGSTIAEPAARVEAPRPQPPAPVVAEAASGPATAPPRPASVADGKTGSREPRPAPRTSVAGNGESRTSSHGVETRAGGGAAKTAGTNPKPAGPEPPTAEAGSRKTTADAPDLLTAARICTDLGRAEDSRQVQPLLRQIATLLNARGVIVWVRDAAGDELKPVLVHGYSNKVRARLSGVAVDADNLTADAFRSCELRAGGGRGSAALAVPLMNSAGCAGVLAIELPEGAEQADPVRAIATFLAAMLGQLVGVEPAARTDAPPASADGRHTAATA